MEDDNDDGAKKIKVFRVILCVLRYPHVLILSMMEGDVVHALIRPSLMHLSCTQCIYMCVKLAVLMPPGNTHGNNKWGKRKGQMSWQFCREDSSNNLLMEHEIMAVLKIY